MQRGRCLVLDPLRQEDYVIPCCVFFHTDVCLFINSFGFIEEYTVKNEQTVLPLKRFPSRIVPLYVFRSMDEFADSWFNFYRMLWNSKWNSKTFLPASTLLLLRKYAVQNDGYHIQTAAYIAQERYEGDLPHLIIKII